MSEYPQPPKLPKTLDQLDNTGTLFETLSESQQQEEMQQPLVPVPVRRLREHEHRYPQTVEERQAWLAQNLAQRAIEEALDDRASPYLELGGHHGSELIDDVTPRLFDELIATFEPWMRDIRLAVDRYGAHELTPDRIRSMTKADQRILALHFDGFLERLKVAHRLISAADGHVDYYPLLEQWYGKDRDQEGMIAYITTLEKLAEALHAAGVAQLLHHIAFDVSHDQKKREAARRRDDMKHGHPQVYFDETKPRIERLPHHDHKRQPVA